MADQFDAALASLGIKPTAAPQGAGAAVGPNDPVWQISPDVQRQRDGDRLTLLQNELSQAKDPTARASLQREIANTQQGIQAPQGQARQPTAQSGQQAQSSGPDMFDRALASLNDPNAGQIPKQAPNINVLPTPLGMAEFGLHTVSGLAGQIAGGWAGILTGGDEKAVQKVSNALTYEPRLESGKAAVEGFNQGVNMLMNAPGVKQVREGYNALTDKAGAASPAAGAALKTLPTAIGLVAAPEVRGAVSSLAKTGTSALGVGAGRAASVAGRVEPTLTGSPSAPASTPALAAPAAPTSTLSGVGAADADYAAQARAEGVPEHIVQRIAQAQDIGTLDATAAARHIEAGSLPVPVELTAGQATGNINMLSHEQNMRGKVPELADRFNAQNDALKSNLDAIRDQVAPDVHAPPGLLTDQALVDKYKAMDQQVTGGISAKYQALADANGGDLPMRGQDFADQALSDLNTAGKAYKDFLPSTVTKMITDYATGEPMAFRDFESARTILGNEARKAARAGDGNAEHAIGIVRNALESMPMGDDVAHLKPLADEARAAAKARFDALKNDPAYKAAVNDGVGIGEASPVADKFIQKYVAGGKTAHVENMINNLGGDAEAQQLVAAGLMDHIKGRAGINYADGTGNVTQAGLNKALLNLGEKTRIVLGPEGAQNLQKLGNVARYTQEQPRGSYVNNSSTFVAKAADKAATAVEHAANFKAYGVPVGTWARNALESRAFDKKVTGSLEPGAGLNKLTKALGKQ